MNYITQSTGMRATLPQIRRAHPMISISSGEPDLAHLGYAKLEPAAPPAPDEGYRVIEGAPEEYAPGQWRQTWQQELIPPTSIPQEVTALQGLLAINQAGLAPGFNAWKGSIDPVSDFATIAFFEKAQTWRRDNPYLIQGAAALGLSDKQIDDLFKLAETL